jgi:hypothetical protein
VLWEIADEIERSGIDVIPSPPLGAGRVRERWGINRSAT